MMGLYFADEVYLRRAARAEGWDYGRALECVRQARVPWQASVAERAEAEAAWCAARGLGRWRVGALWGQRYAFGVGVMLGIEAERRRWL